MSVKSIALEIVCPALGTLMATLMFSAPFLDLKKAVERGDLGNLNPTPWAFMLGNCFGWVLYSVLQQNLWIYFANCPGFLLSIWLNLGATKLQYQGHYSNQMRKSFVLFLEQNSQRQDEQVFVSALSFRLPVSDGKLVSDGKPVSDGKREETKEERTNEEMTTSEKGVNLTTIDLSTATTAVADWAKIVWDVTSQTTPAPAPHEKIVVFVVFVWTAVISIVSLAQGLDKSTKDLIVGTVVNMNLVFFYGAPLSSIFTMLKERSSASIHVPTMITNTLCGTFWFAYGFAIMDFFIIVPNGLGALLGGVQIILCVVFPRPVAEGNYVAEKEIEPDLEQPGVKAHPEQELHEKSGSETSDTTS